MPRRCTQPYTHVNDSIDWFVYVSKTFKWLLYSAVTSFYSIFHLTYQFLPLHIGTRNWYTCIVSVLHRAIDLFFQQFDRFSHRNTWTPAVWAHFWWILSFKISTFWRFWVWKKIIVAGKIHLQLFTDRHKTRTVYCARLLKATTAHIYIHTHTGAPMIYFYARMYVCIEEKNFFRFSLFFLLHNFTAFHRPFPGKNYQPTGVAHLRRRNSFNFVQFW